MTDAEKWAAFVDAIQEGLISVILENSLGTIDGGEIVTDVDDVLDHISSAEGMLK